MSAHTSRLETAILMALGAHLGGKDKSGEPYIRHPLRVMELALAMVDGDNPYYNPSFNDKEDFGIAAVLHDTVEDTSLTLETIRSSFGICVASGVLAVTRLNPAYQDRLGIEVVAKETRREFVLRAKRNPIGRVVKIADITDNLSPWRRKGMAGHESLFKKYEEYLKLLREP